ncbi:MAG TPA: J domain-containing protein [Polyangiaceae bacterium]
MRTTCLAASDDRPTAPPPDPDARAVDETETTAPETSGAPDVSNSDKLRIDEMFASLPGMNHYQVLGVARGADKKSIKRSYCALMARWHPDRWFGKNTGTYGSKLDRIVQRINEAHDALTSRDGRATYDESLPPPPGPRCMDGVDSLLDEAVAEMHGSAEAARHEARWSPRAGVAEEPATAAHVEKPEVPAVEGGRATLPSADAVMVASSKRPSREPTLPPRRRSRPLPFAVAAFAAAAALPLTFHRAPPRSHPPLVAAKAAETISPAPAAPSSAAALPLTPASAETPAAPSTTGKLRVTTPGRRVFVDRHIVGEGPRTFEISCGLHKIRIGSSGKMQTIEIPCGGEVDLGLR